MFAVQCIGETRAAAFARMRPTFPLVPEYNAARTIHQYPGLEELLFHDPGERAAQLPLLILQILHIQSEVHTCLIKLFLGCK